MQDGERKKTVLVFLCPKGKPLHRWGGRGYSVFSGVNSYGEYGLLVQQLGELLLDGFATYVTCDDGAVLRYEYGSGD